MKDLVHVFDLDGTILDSNPAWEEINRKYVQNYGIVCEDCTKMATMSYEAVYEHLLRSRLHKIFKSISALFSSDFSKIFY